MSEVANVSVNINFRSINPDRLREIVAFALLLDHKFSMYVDDEILVEEVEEDEEIIVDPIVYIKSDLVKELKANVPDPKANWETTGANPPLHDLLSGTEPRSEEIRTTGREARSETLPEVIKDVIEREKSVAKMKKLECESRVPDNGDDTDGGSYA